MQDHLNSKEIHTVDIDDDGDDKNIILGVYQELDDILSSGIKFKLLCSPLKCYVLHLRDYETETQRS